MSSVLRQTCGLLASMLVLCLAVSPQGGAGPSQHHRRQPPAMSRLGPGAINKQEAVSTPCRGATPAIYGTACPGHPSSHCPRTSLGTSSGSCG